MEELVFRDGFGGGGRKAGFSTSLRDGRNDNRLIDGGWVVGYGPNGDRVYMDGGLGCWVY
jgi:hypothetical protein